MHRSIVCLLAMICICFGCGLARAADATAGQSAGEDIRIQLKWKHQFQFAGYYAALEKGYYADAGLHVSLIEGGAGHAPVQEMLAGDVQYAVADAGIVLSRAQGDPVVVVAAIFQHSPQVLLTLANITSLQDLRHKRVMMQAGNLTIEVQAMLHQVGLSPADYIRVPIGSLDALIDGRTAAWPGYSNNEGFLLAERGIAFKMFRPMDYGIDFYGDTLVTTTAEVEHHPDRVQAMRRATIKGWEYALTHQQEIIALIKSKYDSQHKSIAHLNYEASGIAALMISSVVPVGFSNKKRWQHIASVFNQMGQPVAHVDWDSFLYQAKPQIAKVLWAERYWLLLGFLGVLIIFLYLYTLQLRRGIRKRTVELEKTSSEYRDILDHMQDAYYRTDMTGKMLWVSLACERQLGYQRQELLGHNLAEIYWEADGRDQFLKALQDNEGVLQHFVVSLRHKDGSKVWAEVNSQFYHNEHGLAGIEGNVRNISERKQAERKRQDLSDQLQQAQKMESIGVLAGGIAHDFNNLLVGVMGNAELAMLDVQEHSEMHQYLQRIFKSATRGADLVRQMLAYSGQGHIVMGTQNLNTLIRDVSELLSTVIGKQIRLNEILMPNLPDVYGDKNQLTQLIMNLMTNASEAMLGKPGNIQICTGVRYLSTAHFSSMYVARDIEPGEFVFLEITDSGCGMDDATQAKIFDPFFTTKETGSGLGLAALLGIVHSHGGTLALRSQVGEGSCFTVFLPRNSSMDTELEVESVEVSEAVALHGAVLLVDDETSVRHVARRMLEREGIDVMTAAHGGEAVDIYRQHAGEIALILMDLTMPEMDGEQAFHAIRAIQPDAKIVLSSGFSELGAAERLRGCGLAGFIRKPYTREVLLKEIARLGVVDNHHTNT